MTGISGWAFSNFFFQARPHFSVIFETKILPQDTNPALPDCFPFDPESGIALQQPLVPGLHLFVLLLKEPPKNAGFKLPLGGTGFPGLTGQNMTSPSSITRDASSQHSSSHVMLPNVSSSSFPPPRRRIQLFVLVMFLVVEIFLITGRRKCLDHFSLDALDCPVSMFCVQ